MSLIITVNVLAVLALLGVSLFTAEGEEPAKEIIGILGVLDFAKLENHYVSPVFGNYFHHGDIVNLRGKVMAINDWSAQLDAQADVYLQAPNGTTALIQKGIRTDAKNTFKLFIPVSNDLQEGKYIVTAEPLKEGYDKTDNEYLTPFFVMRERNYTASYDEKNYPVSFGSIEFDITNIAYDEKNRFLSFDITRVKGNYAPDRDLGYPKDGIFVVCDRNLITGTPFYNLNDIGPNWPGWFENGKKVLVQIYAGSVETSAKITIGGYQ